MPMGSGGYTDNDAIRELRDSVKKLNQSTEKSSFWMMVLTFAIFALTVILVMQGFKK
jgi:hypothetical protein